MGLADMMYLIGVPYGSKEGEDLAGQIMEFIRFHSLATSMKLARHRGPFPGISQSIFSKQNFSFKLNKPLVKPETDFKRPKLDWKSLLKDIKKYGVRNAAQNTIAPTGAIATISGLEGYGCEPVFSLSYVMKTHEGADFDNGHDFRQLYYESKLFAEALKKAGLSAKQREAIFVKVRQKGSCQDIDEVPEAIRRVFVVSSDLTATQHVRMQAALQRFVDNSISKTINFPSNATVEEIEAAYMQAWRLGCKGLTVYVTGSRQNVVLENGQAEEKKENNEPFSVTTNGDFRGKRLVKQQLSAGKNICPECQAPMVKGEGCVTCPECGWSKCDV
jgi:ribonucleoside-diphosphate reductase alpha chain